MQRNAWSWSKQQVDLELPQIGFSGDHWHKPGFVPEESRKLAPYEGRIIFIDPSGRGADECVAVVAYQLHGKIFIPTIFASKDGYGDETLRAIAALGKKHKVNGCIIEANFGKQATAEVKPIEFRGTPYGTILSQAS